MTLEDVAAHLEIQQALYRYCRGVDRGEKAMVASAYHDDGVDNHGGWTGLGKDFGDRVVASMDATGRIGQHHITNSLIQIHGTTADVESYFIAFNPQMTEHSLVCGRYLDRFEQRNGAWLIAHRQVIIDLDRSLHDETSWKGRPDFPAGARRELDPSFGRFVAG